MATEISTVRWPHELYEQIRELAHEKRQSINKTVIELVEKGMAGQQSVKR